MTADIQCLTCSEVMGQLVKETITDEDITLYQQMMTCSNGHHVSTLSPVDPPPGDGS